MTQSEMSYLEICPGGVKIPCTSGQIHLQLHGSVLKPRQGQDQQSSHFYRETGRGTPLLQGPSGYTSEKQTADSRLQQSVFLNPTQPLICTSMLLRTQIQLQALLPVKE